MFFGEISISLCQLDSIIFIIFPKTSRRFYLSAWLIYPNLRDDAYVPFQSDPQVSYINQVDYPNLRDNTRLIYF